MPCKSTSTKWRASRQRLANHRLFPHLRHRDIAPLLLDFASKNMSIALRQLCEAVLDLRKEFATVTRTRETKRLCEQTSEARRKMSRIDAKQLIPMLNPKMTKQQRRSLLSPSQAQLARQIDNHMNIGTLCSILGRPLRSTIKHIKQMAFLDAVQLCLPPEEDQPLRPLPTELWVQIINAPVYEGESPPSLPTFQLPTSSTSIPDLAALRDEAMASLEEAKLNREHQAPDSLEVTSEELHAAHPHELSSMAPETAPPLTLAPPHPQHTPAPPSSQGPAILNLTDDMAMEGGELELPVESAPQSGGFSVPKTPHRFTALNKISEMEWTNEHNKVAQSSRCSQPQPPAHPSPQPPPHKAPKKAPMTPTEEELQLLLASIAQRKRDQGSHGDRGLYHYSSRSQMDMPQPPQQGSHYGSHRPPMTPVPPTHKSTKK